MKTIKRIALITFSATSRFTGMFMCVALLTTPMPSATTRKTMTPTMIPRRTAEIRRSGSVWVGMGRYGPVYVPCDGVEPVLIKKYRLRERERCHGPIASAIPSNVATVRSPAYTITRKHAYFPLSETCRASAISVPVAGTRYWILIETAVR